MILSGQETSASILYRFLRLLIEVGILGKITSIQNEASKGPLSHAYPPSRPRRTNMDIERPKNTEKMQLYMVKLSRVRRKVVEAGHPIA